LIEIKVQQPSFLSSTNLGASGRLKRGMVKKNGTESGAVMIFGDHSEIQNDTFRLEWNI